MIKLIYLVLLCVVILFQSYAANFGDLDAFVERHLGEGHFGVHPQSQLLRPAYAPVARRVVDNQSSSERSFGQMGAFWTGDFLKIPHPRYGSMTEWDDPVFFPKTAGAALGGFFFPTRAERTERTPNTISRNDPVGKLNQGRQDQKLWKNMSARLGDLVAVTHNTLLAGQESFNKQDTAKALLKALGHKKQSAVFGKVTVEDFAQYELLMGLQEFIRCTNETLQGASLHEVREFTRDLEVPSVLSLFERITAGEDVPIQDYGVLPHVKKNFFDVVDGAALEEFVENKGKTVNGVSITNHLMALRKRHLAHVLAATIGEDLQQGTHYPVSLSTLMTYVWRTRDEGLGLAAFYAHALGDHQLEIPDDVLRPTPVSELLALLDSLKQRLAHALVYLPLAYQMAVLSLDRQAGDIHLPGSGTAFVEGMSYSVCVESMILDALIHACRHPFEKRFEFEKLPKNSPLHGYFEAHKDDLFSQTARNDWARLTRRVEKIVRVDGGRGLEPSFRNVILMFQFLMGDETLNITPVRTEETYERTVADYGNFLKAFSTWLSAPFDWNVEFTIESTRWQDGRRIVGGIKLQANMDVQSLLLGTLCADSGHGHYDINIYGNSAGKGGRGLIERVSVPSLTPPHLVFLTGTLAAVWQKRPDLVGKNFDILLHTRELMKDLFAEAMVNPTAELRDKIEHWGHKMREPGTFFSSEMYPDGVAEAVLNKDHPGRPLQIETMRHLLGAGVPQIFNNLAETMCGKMSMMEMAHTLGLTDEMCDKVLPYMRKFWVGGVSSRHDATLRWASILRHMPQLKILHIDSAVSIAGETPLDPFLGNAVRGPTKADLEALRTLTALKEIRLYDDIVHLQSGAWVKLLPYMPPCVKLIVGVNTVEEQPAETIKDLWAYIQATVKAAAPQMRVAPGANLEGVVTVDDAGDVAGLGVEGVTDKPTEVDLIAAGDV